MSTQITPEDREAAHACLTGSAAARSCDVQISGVRHGVVCTAIAQAIADRGAAARREAFGEAEQFATNWIELYKRFAAKGGNNTVDCARQSACENVRDDLRAARDRAAPVATCQATHAGRVCGATLILMCPECSAVPEEKSLPPGKDRG